MNQEKVLLLWGETGSGKTEVYMRIVEDQFLRKKLFDTSPRNWINSQLIDRFSAAILIIMFTNIIVIVLLIIEL